MSLDIENLLTKSLKERAEHLLNYFEYSMILDDGSYFYQCTENEHDYMRNIIRQLFSDVHVIELYGSLLYHEEPTGYTYTVDINNFNGEFWDSIVTPSLVNDINNYMANN